MKDVSTILGSALLVDRQKNTAVGGLALALFVFGVGTDDHYPATSFNYAAFFTDLFYGCSNFHAKWGHYCKFNIIP
jgi:hypothetical protein